MKRRAVIYVRISKDRDNETSTGTQEHEARLFCELKGWEVIAVCVDPGRSAFKRGVKRPELERALELVEVGAADVLVVWKLNRFTRSVTDFWDYWSRINEAGGQFASVTESLDTTSAMGRGVVGLLASFAEMESEAKSDQSKAWNDGRVRNGQVPQGPRPYGYDRSLNTLTINPDEAEVIRQAAKRILTGGSLRSVITDFTPTSSRGDQPLTTRGLRSALMNPTTAGVRVSKGEVITGTWEPVLDRETWEQVCEALRSPERKTNHSGNQPLNLLSGIMACGKTDCDGFIGPRNWLIRKGPQKGTMTQRYQCRECGNSIWKDQADEAVSARLLSLVPQAEWESLRTQGRGYNPQVIQALEDEAASYIAMAAKGTIKPEALNTIMQGINERMASATGDEPLDLPAVENLEEGWKVMSISDKRRVLRVVLASVTLNPSCAGKGIERIVTERTL